MRLQSEHSIVAGRWSIRGSAGEGAAPVARQHAMHDPSRQMPDILRDLDAGATLKAVLFASEAQGRRKEERMRSWRSWLRPSETQRSGDDPRRGI